MKNKLKSLDDNTAAIESVITKTKDQKSKSKSAEPDQQSDNLDEYPV